MRAILVITLIVTTLLGCPDDSVCWNGTLDNDCPRAPGDFVCPEGPGPADWPDGCENVASLPSAEDETRYSGFEKIECPTPIVLPVPETDPDGMQEGRRAGQVSYWTTEQGTTLLGKHDAVSASLEDQYVSVDVLATVAEPENEITDLIVFGGQLQAQLSMKGVAFADSPELTQLELKTTATDSDKQTLHIQEIMPMTGLPDSSGRFVDPMASTPEPGQIPGTPPYMYKLTWNNSNGDALCDGDNWAVAMPGLWYKDGAYNPARRTRISFACVDELSPVGKCIERLAYVPHLTHTSWSDEVAACSRALRGDICGCGKSYTFDNTHVDVYGYNNTFSLSFPNPHPPHPHNGAFRVYDYADTTQDPNDGTVYWFEAGWDADGAVCLSKLRWNTLGFPSCGKNDRLVNPRNSMSMEQVSKEVCDVADGNTGQLRSLGVAPVTLFTSSKFNDLGLLEWVDPSLSTAYSTARGFPTREPMTIHTPPPECPSCEYNQPLEQAGNTITSAGIPVLIASVADQYPATGLTSDDFIELRTYICPGGVPVTTTSSPGQCTYHGSQGYIIRHGAIDDFMIALSARLNFIPFFDEMTEKTEGYLISWQ